ncbi:hypothetical protein C0995_003251 [Termitomyces sp. Mi166|nr:hypothetical protein C0995_003251 [Termitomyces sp. Mi166\
MDHDTSWCPVCDRAIQPKRLQVPVPVTQPAPTPAPPPSPTSARRTKPPPRQRAGLVQGTGRLKPNGTLKPQQQPPVTRYRTVIDQGPTPLYCSNECHAVDRSRDVYRDPHSDDSSTSASVNSFDSHSSVVSAPPIATPETEVPPSLRVMKEYYGWRPFPPPAPVDDPEPLEATPPVGDFNNGIIMTARRINAEFLPPPPKRDGRGNMIREPRKPIPGWTDGSNAWRSTVYNLSAPDAPASVKHQPFALRGSRGVQSTFSHPRQQVATSARNVVSDEDRNRLDKFSQSFRRTSSSNTIPSSPLSSASFPPSRKERPLVQRGAEGKLLVPNVMMRVNSHASTTSLSSQWSNHRSPLSQDGSSDGEDVTRSQRCDSAGSLPRQPKRPTVETRSWSYDNVKTYPTMCIPKKTRIEKRKEKQVVNGEEVEVEVEVEVEEKLKRLFLFAPWTAATATSSA